MSEFTNRIFQRALKYVFEKTNTFNSQKELALTAQVSEGMISDMLSGSRNYGERSHLKVANACGYRLEDFYKLGIRLEEGAEVENKKKNINEKRRSDKIKPLTHDEIIRLFKDENRAKEINYMLSEIEKENPEKYNKIDGYITAIYEEVKQKKTENGNS